MNLAAMLLMPFTCRANPSDRANTSSLKPIISERFIEIPVSTTPLACKSETRDAKEKEGLGAGPPNHVLWL